MGEWALLFDADCGFCRWSAATILRVDRRRRLRAVAIQSTEGRDLLATVPPERRLDSWHLWAPDASVTSAGRAVAPLLRLLPGGSPAAFVAERTPRTVDRLYALVARNRGRLARIVGRRACAVDPAELSRRAV